MPDEEETPNMFSAMMQFNEALAPLFDMAKGMKAQMEADGWSPTAAEDVSRELLVGMIRKTFNS